MVMEYMSLKAIRHKYAFYSPSKHFAFVTITVKNLAVLRGLIS